MKSERRHELQHNTLADWLAKSAETIKPYQNMALAAAAAILIAVLGYTWWTRESAAQTTQAWDELNAIIGSGNVAKLAEVTENYPNTNVAHMAAVLLADFQLGEGCNRLFVNKAIAQDELNRAIKLYDSVRQESRLPSLMERATFGLARAKEAKGDLGPAEQLYGEVAAKWPNGAYAAAASQRLEDLKRPATKSLYDRFAHFDPKPAFSSEPGQRPSFDLNSLPSDAPADLPETRLDLKPDGKDKGEEAEKKVPEEK